MEDSEALSQFCAITGASEHTARFYLVSLRAQVIRVPAPRHRLGRG